MTCHGLKLPYKRVRSKFGLAQPENDREKSRLRPLEKKTHINYRIEAYNAATPL